MSDIRIRSIDAHQIGVCIHGRALAVDCQRCNLAFASHPPEAARGVDRGALVEGLQRMIDGEKAINGYLRGNPSVERAISFIRDFSAPAPDADATAEIGRLQNKNSDLAFELSRITRERDEVLDANTKLMQAPDALREALEWYAIPGHYVSSEVHMGGGQGPTQADVDGGQRARAALGEGR